MLALEFEPALERQAGLAGWQGEQEAELALEPEPVALAVSAAVPIRQLMSARELAALAVLEAEPAALLLEFELAVLVPEPGQVLLLLY